MKGGRYFGRRCPKVELVIVQAAGGTIGCYDKGDHGDGGLRHAVFVRGTRRIFRRGWGDEQVPLFLGSESVEFGLLRTIRLLTHAFEVRDKSLRDWEESILVGYRVWREMVANKGAV